MKLERKANTRNQLIMQITNNIIITLYMHSIMI